METQEIEQILKDALNINDIYVQGENSHFGVIVVDDELAKLSRVKQQQLIYAPLMNHFSSGAIHALTIKTFSREKWKRERLFNPLN
ncbi:acid stress-induced BolA-like protein IbaG/YrbA [Bisgaardia hudsonensis]|uniref:Acid stress-induced BolA-like protein IbaG/YrbA n=1 Tax=Bisgaardia hudsonensis TaxID=109472 RepID=A0A4R2N057_9PAST|nr:BolA family protein [Bisgaardia hudsonensis]QLB13338.1 hypothetical protein A6A11_06830 [Bisgaardia hudsonensis]TCP12739.1 acid stress-induced BolA-like protein IbaG/YrbA [Bisgaardia hudsonensis]